MTADFLLHGGRVLTLDPHCPAAEAVAIANGKVLAVGSESELKSLLSPQTQFLSCRGGTVLPGFIDPHLHLFSWASRFCGVELGAARSIAEIQQRLTIHLLRVHASKWVRGYGYDEFFLVEKRHPTKRDLDAVSAGQPILLRHRSGHAAVLNSAALRLAGIDRHFQSPPGGHIERDETGEPNGVTYELEPFLRTVAPPLAQDEFALGLKHVSMELLRQGVTSFHDASAGNSLEDLALFRRLHDEDVLASRATVMVGVAALPQVVEAGLAPFSGDDRVRLGSIKIMVHESRGTLSPPPEEMAEIVWQAHKRGFQVALHAVEEGPICVALAAIARAQERLPRSDHRHRIEHCSLCPLPLVNALVETGSVVVTQPGFVHFYGEKYAAEIDPELHAWLYRTKSLLTRGVQVAGSSDCPIAPVAPLLGISAAMTRRTRSGDIINKDERLSLAQALSLFISSGAWVGFEEMRKGRIAPGMLADLVILDGDIVQVPPEQIPSVQVQMTVIGGKIVWSAES